MNKKHSLLLVSAMEGVENAAQYLSRELNINIVVAHTCRSALAVLRRTEFTLVVCDTSLVKGEDVVVFSSRMGYAIPIELNLAGVGIEKLARRVRNVVERREQEILLTRRAVRKAVGDTLRNEFAGLLLQSDLILKEKSLPQPLLGKLAHFRQMADGICVSLQTNP